MPTSNRKANRKSDSPAPAAQPALTPDVMTIEELARYLRLAVATLYKKVRAHATPFAKVGNLLRFTKDSIDHWLARDTTTPDDGLYEQFGRLQNRYHFQRCLEDRGVDWRTLADAQLAALAAKAPEELHQPATPPTEG